MPTTYASKLRNRFKNAEGGAEKRQGISQLGEDVPGIPTLTGIHELVSKTGSATLFVSGGGNIYKYDGTTETYSQVYSGWDTSAIIRSVQMGDKIIFYNGVDRSIWTEDTTTFTELRAIMEQGVGTTGTDSTHIYDADVADWATGTDVTDNDLVYNRTLGAYGLVTAVSASAVTHTGIGAASTGIGVATTAQAAGHGYDIVDLVELNIIPTEGADDDNTAVLASGSSSVVVRVSGVDFSTTDARVGDIISNTTKAAVTDIVSVSADINVTSVSGQAAGDSIVFLKSAMPIPTFAHVHFGRLYSIDSRDERKVRISGANDPEDMTSDAGTLDSITYNFGTLQPQGDALVALGSFQRYFIAMGQKYLYAYSGTTPIGTGADFTPAGMFPHGLLSPNAVTSIGNDLVFVTNDGMQSIALVDDASNLSRSALSDQIRTTLREELSKTPASAIQVIHYPRRSWILLKVGSQTYCYNYTSFTGDPNRSIGQEPGSWALFDGKFAQQNAYYIRRNGDLVSCGAGGKVYEFDKGVYSDDGLAITTEYRTGWLTLDEPKKTVRHKRGVFIKPVFDAGGNFNYTIRAEAGFDSEATDTITVTTSGGSQPIGLAVVGQSVIGGSSVKNDKYDFRWKGEVVRVTFENDHTSGPDIIDKFTLYANVYGRR